MTYRPTSNPQAVNDDLTFSRDCIERELSRVIAERDALRAQLEAVRHHWWSVMGKTNRRSIMAQLLDADPMEFAKKGGAK